MSDELPEVVSLDQFRIDRAKSRYCPHRAPLLDVHARRLECGHCNAPLDPFDSLLSLVNSREHLKFQRQQLEAEIGRKRVLVEEFKRQLSNVKAAAKRGGVKLVGLGYSEIEKKAKELPPLELHEQERGVLAALRLWKQRDRDGFEKAAPLRLQNALAIVERWSAEP